jgi:F-type H+-transporting ATPase subunit b
LGRERWIEVVAGAGAALLPAVAWASGGGQEVELESGFTLAMRFLNFLLLAGLLYYLLNKPIRNFLTQRQQGVRESLEEAERARQEAHAKYQEMERRLGQAQKEMEELRKMLVEQGRAEKERILAHAQKEAEKIRRQAEITAEQEFKKAQLVLRREAAELAARIAGTILKERIDAKDHERLIKDYVETMGKSAG